MKRKIVSIVAMAATASAFAADFVWTGNTQHAEDWFDVNNWTVDNAVPETYPQAGDTATFNKDASLNVNSDITVGTLVLNANLTHRRDKWLKVGAIEGTGKIFLKNRGRLEFINSSTMDVTTPIDLSSNDSGQLLYVKTSGSGEVNLKGPLTGDAEVSFEGSLKLYGDNSGFEGTGKIHGASYVEFRTPEAGSAKATWIYDGKDKKTSRINIDGDIYFGALQQTQYGPVDFRVNISETAKAANLVIGNDSNVDSVIMGSWGDANNNSDRPNSYSKITKVGSSTLRVYCPWHRLGTEIRGGVLEAIGPDALTGRNTASISPIVFTGGTLRYGTDTTTDSANPAEVTTDWSALVKDSTEFISVDTYGHDITWTSESIYNNNPDAKGFVKKGEGTLDLVGTKRDGTWKFFSDATKTNIIDGGTIAIRNAKYNSDYTLASTILGSGTLKICSEEHLGGIRLHGTTALADFTGTLDWANELAEREVDGDENVKSYASGLRMTDSINFEMPNAAFRVSGNPAEPTAVMLVETQWNPDSAHVTVGAYQHLHPNAVIWTDRSRWTLNITGTAGDSYLNGTFSNQCVNVVKTGVGKLTVGPGLSAPEGSLLNVKEGEFAWNRTTELSGIGMTLADDLILSGTGTLAVSHLPSTFKFATAEEGETVLTIDGPLSLAGATVVFDPAAADKSKTYPVVNATSFTGSATLTDDGNDGKGRWKLLSRTVEGKRQLYAMWTKNALVIFIR